MKVALSCFSAFAVVLVILFFGQRASGNAHEPNHGSMEQQIVAKERAELDALKAGDLETFGNLTADDAVFIDDHGPANKAQVLKNVAGFKLLDYSIEDVKFIPISATAGLLTYKLNEKGNSHGKEFAAQVYVSSIWTKRRNNWVCTFSQETAK